MAEEIAVKKVTAASVIAGRGFPFKRSDATESTDALEWLVSNGFVAVTTPFGFLGPDGLPEKGFIAATKDEGLADWAKRNGLVVEPPYDTIMSHESPELKVPGFKRKPFYKIVGIPAAQGVPPGIAELLGHARAGAVLTVPMSEVLFRCPGADALRKSVLVLEDTATIRGLRGQEPTDIVNAGLIDKVCFRRDTLYWLLGSGIADARFQKGRDKSVEYVQGLAGKDSVRPAGGETISGFFSTRQKSRIVVIRPNCKGAPRAIVNALDNETGSIWKAAGLGGAEETENRVCIPGFTPCWIASGGDLILKLMDRLDRERAQAALGCFMNTGKKAAARPSRPSADGRDF